MGRNEDVAWKFVNFIIGCFFVGFNADRHDHCVSQLASVMNIFEEISITAREKQDHVYIMKVVKEQ